MTIERLEVADDPHEIANALVQEHGLNGALDQAIAETTTANQQFDYYNLSIWREVKRILRERSFGSVGIPPEPKQ